MGIGILSEAKAPCNLWLKAAPFQSQATSILRASLPIVPLFLTALHLAAPSACSRSPARGLRLLCVANGNRPAPGKHAPRENSVPALPAIPARYAPDPYLPRRDMSLRPDRGPRDPWDEPAERDPEAREHARSYRLVSARRRGARSTQSHWGYWQVPSRNPGEPRSCRRWPSALARGRNIRPAASD